MNEHTASTIWLNVYSSVRVDNKSHAEAMTAATQAVKNFNKVYKLVSSNTTPTE